ncbi:hypothetical protein ACNOYE_03735 [Nannocystaceae bacterium ST9]
MRRQSPPRALALALLLAACTVDEGSADLAEGESESGDDTTTSAGETDTGEATDAGETTDTEGEATDTEGETTGDEDDALAAAACEALAGTTTAPILAAASAEEAATSIIVPDPALVYEVSLPEGAPGFVSLQIPEWKTTQAFFTLADIDYVVSVPSGDDQGPRETNAACPELGFTDQRIYFEHWTPALIEFSAEGPRQVPLMVVQQSP